jgi:hypothetical protein
VEATQEFLSLLDNAASLEEIKRLYREKE